MLKANFKLLTRKTRSQYPKSRRRSLRSTSIQHNVTHPMVKKQQRIFELPAELIAEILKRLQVKYILRCMLVQKSWYYLIKSSVFIKLHLEYQNIAAHKYLFFETTYAGKFTVRYDDIQCEEYCEFKYLPGLPMCPFWYRISDGLMCVSRMFINARRYDSNIYLWNPLIQKYKTLPDSPLCKYTFAERKWQALAFGFVPQVSDYVVVHIVKLRYPYSVIIGIYSLNADSWKIKKHNNDTILSIRSIRDYDVVFVNGAAFWLGINLAGHGIILCFDTKTDILRVILLPNSVKDQVGNDVIHPSGQSIAYFAKVFKDNKYESSSEDSEISEESDSSDYEQDDSKNYGFEDEEYEDYNTHFLEMWVLGNSLINECSWAKKMRISMTRSMERKVLGVRNNGEPILAKRYNLISYNLDNHEANDIVYSWNRWTPFTHCNIQYNYNYVHKPPFFICPFVENLVLLNTE